MLHNKISSHDLQHHRLLVDQLRREVKLDRLKVSQCANDILQYCEQQEAQDPLVNPNHQNPFKNTNKGCKILNLATEWEKFYTDSANPRPPNPPVPPPVRRSPPQGLRDQRRKKRLEEIHRAKYVAMGTANGSRNENGAPGPSKGRKRRRRRRVEKGDKTGEKRAPLNGQKITDGDLEKITSATFPTLPTLFRKFKKPRKQPGTLKPTKEFLHQSE